MGGTRKSCKPGTTSVTSRQSTDCPRHHKWSQAHYRCPARPQSRHGNADVDCCSPDHFPLARLPRLAAYIRRRCSRVLFASFIRALGSFALASLRSRFALASLSLRSRFALASLSSAMLCSRFCSSRASLSSLLLSCLAFPLSQARHPS